MLLFTVIVAATMSLIMHWCYLILLTGVCISLSRLLLLLCVELRAEVEKLKQLSRTAVGDDVLSHSHREVAWLRQQLTMKESEMIEMKRSVCSCLLSVVAVSDVSW